MSPIKLQQTIGYYTLFSCMAQYQRAFHRKHTSNVALEHNPTIEESS